MLGATMNGSEFFGQIKRGFGLALDFTGRDRRGQFWPYAAAVFVLTQVISMAVLLPTIIGQVVGSLSTAERLARAHPEDWQVERGAGSVSYHYVGSDPEVLHAMMPDFSGIMATIGLIAIVTIALMAAAVTRRLHDRGRSGLWAAIPVTLLLLAFWQMHNIFGGVTDAAMAQDGSGLASVLFLGFGLNLLYLIAVTVLIIQLALAGQPAANRYGQPPS